MTSTAACTAVGRAFRSFGSIVEVRASSPALLDALIARLPPFSRPLRSTRAPAMPHLVTFVRDAGPCACGESHLAPILFRGEAAQAGSLDELMAAHHQIVKFFVARRAPDRVFVHAGAVGWQGRMLVIPGRSMSGKTSLVVALLRAGASYYSDEYAVIDRDGLVHPYPQDLGVRAPGGPMQQPVPPAREGWRRGVKPLPIGLVALTSYKPDARWRGRPVSKGRGILEMLTHTIQHADHPERALDFLNAAVAGSAAIVRGVRGEAEATARAMLARLAANPVTRGLGPP